MDEKLAGHEGGRHCDRGLSHDHHHWRDSHGLVAATRGVEVEGIVLHQFASLPCSDGQGERNVEKWLEMPRQTHGHEQRVCQVSVFSSHPQCMGQHVRSGGEASEIEADKNAANDASYVGEKAHV